MTTRLSVLACLLAVALAGCRENDASIEIFALCAPPDDAEACGMTGECEAYLASDRPFVFTRRIHPLRGVIPNQLELFVQVNNQLPNNANASTGRANTNDFIAEEYVLNYRGANGIPEIRHPANFAIAAASAFSPVIPIIPETAMAAISAAIPAGLTPRLVIAEIMLRGHLVDGSSVETGIFEVAVDVTNETWGGFVCPDPTEFVVAVCPNDGQTASIACKAP